MITDQEFEAVCRQKLQFLEEDFGCRLVAVEPSRFGSAVLYQNHTTALRIRLDPRDCRIFIMLYSLVDGHLPQYANLAAQDSDVMNKHSLSDLINLRNPSLYPEQGYVMPPKLGVRKKDLIIKQAMLDFDAERVGNILDQYAVALRECAADVLQGDFHIFEELAKIVRKRIEGFRQKQDN